MERKYKVLATDGQDFWQLYFLKYEDGDIYHGPVIPSLGGKYTRHSDGKKHYKFESADGEEIYGDLGEGQSIEEFEGMEQIHSSGSSVEGTKKAESLYKGYTGSKFDGSLIIDIRDFGEDISLGVYLLEPGRTGFVDSLTDMHGENTQVTIFSEIEPWIVVVIGSHGD